MEANTESDELSAASHNLTPFEFQSAAIQSILSGKDTVVIAPVGAGKSFISRLALLDPAAPPNAMMVIVTPFEVLPVEQDQGDGKAIYLNEETHTPETMRNIVEKRYQRIYTTLKRLDGPVFQKLLRDEQWLKSLIAIVVEDAHAVVEQGDVVRSRYKQLSALRHCTHRTIPLLVLSPTLPLHVYYHLEETLELKRTNIINIGCDRPNVSMSVTEFQYKEESYGDIACLNWELFKLEANPATKLEKTIIYMDDNNEVVRLFRAIKNTLEPAGLSGQVHYCHTNSSSTHRKIIEEGFRGDVFRVLVVTDHPDVVSGALDVERVIQWKADDSGAACLRHLCSAGRDGRMSESVVICQRGLLGPKKPTSDPEDTKARALGKIKKTMDWRWVASLEDESQCFRARLLKLSKGPDSTITINDTTSASTSTPNPKCCSVCMPNLLPPKGPKPASNKPAKLNPPPASRTSEELRSKMKRAILDCTDELWEGGEKRTLSFGGKDLILSLDKVDKAVEVGIRIGTGTSAELLERHMRALVPFERFVEPFMRAMTLGVEAWDAKLAKEAQALTVKEVQGDMTASASNE